MISHEIEPRRVSYEKHDVLCYARIVISRWMENTKPRRGRGGRVEGEGPIRVEIEIGGHYVHLADVNS